MAAFNVLPAHVDSFCGTPPLRCGFIRTRHARHARLHPPVAVALQRSSSPRGYTAPPDSSRPLRGASVRLQRASSPPVRPGCAENACCKRMFQVFQMYIVSVSDVYCKSRSGCCICCNGYTHMLQVFYLNVAYISHVHICCSDYKHMLQVYIF
jgi:hypothetical protein